MALKSEFREENLYALWEIFCKSKSWSNDLRLQGLHAGKLNRCEGPDFQGAEFELDGKIYHGDVEIHRDMNDWYHHRHHLDRRYNSVRLHLVWQQDPDVSIYTSDKKSITTMDIKNLSASLQHQKTQAICRLSDISSETLKEKLKILSLNRLNYKIARVKDLVNRYSYDQTIYVLMMRILGSPNNASNFEHLASLLPWEKIINIKNQYKFTSELWFKFYLHVSGLKPQKSRLYDENEFIQFSKLVNNTATIPFLNWQKSGQRPYNNPEYHLKILAQWFTHFPSDSLYFTFKRIISQRLPAAQLILNLNEVFSYNFPIHIKSGNTTINKKSTIHWGKPKLNEIIGNVILPFFYWEALNNLSFGFQTYLEEFFFTLPQLNQYSKLEKIRRSVAGGKSLTHKFYNSQGLLYLLENHCLTGECRMCPFADTTKEIDKDF